MRATRSACCARAVSGQAAATPPRSVMNSRRLIGDPEGSGQYRLRLAHWKRPKSALGQKQTSALQKGMSTLPPITTAKADIRWWISEATATPLGRCAAPQKLRQDQ